MKEKESKINWGRVEIVSLVSFSTFYAILSAYEAGRGNSEMAGGLAIPLLMAYLFAVKSVVTRIK